MQFLKFENMILLMSLIKRYFDFVISRDRDVIDLITAKRSLEQGKFSTQTYLVPQQRHIEEAEELQLARLPLFARNQTSTVEVEAQNQTSGVPAQGADYVAPKKHRKAHSLQMNIIQESNVVLPAAGDANLHARIPLYFLLP